MSHLLRLYLKKLQHQTNERRRLNITSINTSNESQLHRFIHHQFGCECETRLLPKLAVVNTRTDNLLNEVLRVRTVDVFGILQCSVRHCLHSERQK